MSVHEALLSPTTKKQSFKLDEDAVKRESMNLKPQLDLVSKLTVQKLEGKIKAITFCESLDLLSICIKGDIYTYQIEDNIIGFCEEGDSVPEVR